MALNCVLFANIVIRQQSHLNAGSSQCKWTTDHRKIADIPAKHPCISCFDSEAKIPSEMYAWIM